MNKKNAAMTRQKRGRPSKVTELNLGQVEGLASLGLTDEEIALVLGVHERTLNRWKKRPDFCQALKKGKLMADTKVLKGLYERAVGYDIYARDGVSKLHVPGDLVAMIFWIKNRQPDRWRDKQDLEHYGKIDTGGKLVVEVVHVNDGPGKGNGRGGGKKGNGE